MRAIPAMVNHPVRGRALLWVSPTALLLVFQGVWVPDDTHPLGGRDGTVVLARRVNLSKGDPVPRHLKHRPLYEFTKETP